MEETLFADILRETAGFASNRDRGLRYPEARITEVHDLIYNSMIQGNHIAPHVREFALREALTTSDFPYLFGDVLDRQVLAAYKATEPVWKKFTKMSTNKDFRNSDRYRFSGGDEVLALVGEKGEYLASDRTEARYRLQVAKYGRQFDISWEAMINDDLGALKDTPARFAKAALRTEHYVVSKLYVHDTTMATAGRGNLTANPLTIANLETALEWFAAQLDVGGEPIANRAKFLVVPPALELTARQILTSALKQELDYTTRAAGPISYPMPTTNVIANMGLELVIDPYITTIDTASGKTQSAVGGWYLFSDPKDLAALEAAHLRGHELPEICMKASDKVTIGGGAINALSGDFATDNVFYRVRIVFGGVQEEWRAFYRGGDLD